MFLCLQPKAFVSWVLTIALNMPPAYPVWGHILASAMLAITILTQLILAYSVN